jgi:GH25 family lysozyme M1 (1,4-beta-N-acetylmuramidase)
VARYPFTKASPLRSARRSLVLLAVASLAAMVPSAFAVGCAKGLDNGESTAADLVEPDSAIESGVAPPRTVCPSARAPDGGWVTVDGLDVSDYKVTNWEEVVARNPSMKFGFARVSAGLIRVDTRFSFDWTGMKRVGLARGAYQYFKPNQNAVDQAQLFLRRLEEEGGLEAGDLPPVLDLETTNGMPDATVTCRAKIWLAHVERATGRIPMIYASSEHNALLPPELRRFPLWVPNYVATPSRTCPRTPTTWDKWTMWQYTDALALRGVYANAARDDDAGGVIELQDGGDGGPVVTPVDLNFFDGTLADLNRFIASTVSTTSVSDPSPLVDPPHVAASDAAADCSDGCCVGGP